MANWGSYKTVDAGDIEVYVELNDDDIKSIIQEHGKSFIQLVENELRMAVRAIRNGQDILAITCLQRAFGHDIAMVELIETEWRKK